MVALKDERIMELQKQLQKLTGGGEKPKTFFSVFWNEKYIVIPIYKIKFISKLYQLELHVGKPRSSKTTTSLSSVR